jgi:hypothetical protein
MKKCLTPIWKTYTGLQDTFEYCDACGAKRSDHYDSTNDGGDNGGDTGSGYSGGDYHGVSSNTTANNTPVLPVGLSAGLPNVSPAGTPWTGPYSQVPITSRAFHNLCPVKNVAQAGNYIVVPLKLNNCPVYNTTFFIPKEVEPQFAPSRWIHLVMANPVSNTYIKYGVDLMKDPARLAGVIYDGYLSSHKEAFMQCLYLVDKGGGYPRDYFLSVSDFASLYNEIGYTNLSATRFIVSTAYRKITVHLDTDLTKGEGYLLQMDTWARDPVFGTYCTAPGYNGKVYLP